MGSFDLATAVLHFGTSWIGGCMRLRMAVLALACGGLVIGCGSDEEQVATPAAPVILKQSKQAVVVGETLEFYGRNFVQATANTRVATIEDNLKLNFVGVFIDQAGEQTRVDAFRSFPI